MKRAPTSELLVDGQTGAAPLEGPTFPFCQADDLTFLEPGPPLEYWTGLSWSQWSSQPGLLRRCLAEVDVSQFDRHLLDATKTAEGSVMLFSLRHQVTGRLTHLLERRRARRFGSALPSGYECVWLDVTRQRRERRRLHDLIWKENLVHFTRGFAHEFNNILAGVMSLSDFFLTQIDEQHPFHEGLSMMRKQFHHGAALLTRLTGVFQGKPGQLTVHDLNSLTREAAALARDITARRIEIVVRTAEVDLPVYLDAFEFRQQVIGLALNAADAIAGSGHVTFETAAFERMPATAHFYGRRPPEAAVCLTLRDDGPGFSAEEVIFDSNYTTKPSTHGCGLGLSLARAFAEESGGGISVESSPGAGSALSFWWPQADFTEADAAAAAEKQRRRCVLAAGPDDEVLRKTIASLRTEGYEVVLSSAQTALLLGAGEDRFDLLYMRAPELSGEWMEVLRVARKHRIAPHVVLQVQHSPAALPGVAGLTSLVLPWEEAPDEVVSQLIGLVSANDGS